MPRFFGLRHPCWSLMAGWLATLGADRAAIADGAAAGPPQQWAVIIAVRHYENLRGKDLDCTIRDALALKATLATRGGVPEGNVLMMTDEAGADLQPRGANLRERIGPFLKRAGAADRVIVYFSGHGLLVDGRSVLLPADYRGEEPGSALPVEFVRDALRDCPAAAKFLILDCCHAGGEKGIESTDGGDAPVDFKPEDFRPRKQDNFVTLASCRADQKSLQWFGKGMSFFSYWLCRALEGGADKDGDGNLTFNEVYDYTSNRVRDSVEKTCHQDQNPVRAINQQIQGDPILLTLRPERPETLCRRLAAEVDVEIRARKFRRVALRRFAPPVLKDDELAGANFTSLMPEKIRAALADFAKVAPGAYEVADGLLPGFGQDTTRDADRLQAKAARAPGGAIDALIDGSLRRTAGKLQVACDLIEVAGAGSVAQFSSRMPSLRPEDYADVGVSFDSAVTKFRPVEVATKFKPVDPGKGHDSTGPTGGETDWTKPGQSFAEAGTTAVPGNRPGAGTFASVQTNPPRDPAAQLHPLDPRANSSLARDFQVEIWAVGATEPKRAVFKGNAMIVGVRKGERYEVRVWNRSGKRVGVSMLIDGVDVWGVQRREMARAGVWTLAPRLDSAYPFDAFYDEKQPTPVGQMASYRGRRFEFSDVAESVGAQQGVYADDIGNIAVAIYAEADTGDKGIGTKLGEAIERPMTAENFRVGKVLGSMIIRYVEAGDLQMAAAR